MIYASSHMFYCVSFEIYDLLMVMYWQFQKPILLILEEWFSFAEVGVVLFSLTKAREQGLISIRMMYDADDWFTSSFV